MNVPFTTPLARQGHPLLLGLALFIMLLVWGDYVMLSQWGPVPLKFYTPLEQAVPTQQLPISSSSTERKARPSLPAQRRSRVPREAFKRKLTRKISALYGCGGGYVRGIVLLLSLVLLVGQKPPARRPGQPRKKPLPGEVRQTVYLLSGLLYLLSAYLLLAITSYSAPFITYAYPLALVGVYTSSFMSGWVLARGKPQDFQLTASPRRIDSPNGFCLPTQEGGFINVPNAFRGCLVLGGAGAGKSYSIGEPVIEQFAAKNFAGIIYDFKFPILVEVAQRALALASWRRDTGQGKSPFGETGPEVQLHVINFRDLERTERINPLRPQDMPVMAFAEEYSRTIIYNLNTHTIRNTGEFFSSSAIAYLTGIIWFYRKHYPRYCTLPHVVATALYKDFRHVLSMLDTDVECGDLVRSLITAVESKADKQIAGVVATLQVILTRINSPEMVWVLTPDEERGEGISLHLNDPKHPKLLCIGNDSTLKDSFSPVISCIIAVALKLMNQPGQHPSYVLLDEAATLYVPGLEVIPATARSNRIATVYMSQDLSQMIDSYGREKTQVMVSNLNNWFIGKVNNVETAELISRIVGREEKEMVSVSAGSSTAGKGHRNISHGQSVSFQERHLVRLQDAITLEQGEFIGQTVETEFPFFQGVISRKDAPETRMALEPFVHFTDEEQEGEEPDVKSIIVQANFEKVRNEVRDIVELYPNTLAADD